ncbi:GNAT family N-acetyltransferase [Sphaerisporangium sp. TRM90804]|uniref:GNAT family N-acetyltransferase n=1 Tax=Sphaerisporangium sp. TRM90804 TaxID=3031113 RepID=UPI002449AF1F|nr:GNAT family N-acetyltransferase [Sphaerisporangium sp. TRM90804]MDH2430418.1 GNAT family N-acetyltransferase [Sphaerisporangium sp. TRM90804]
MSAPETTDVTVRTAVPGDVEAVLAFWREAGYNTAGRNDTLDAVERLVSRDPEALLIAEIDGRTVGTLVAGWDGWRCHLYRLAVDAGHRRRGVARTLLAAAEARFARLGGTRRRHGGGGQRAGPPGVDGPGLHLTARGGPLGQAVERRLLTPEPACGRARPRAHARVRPHPGRRSDRRVRPPGRPRWG